MADILSTIYTKLLNTVSVRYSGLQSYPLAPFDPPESYQELRQLPYQVDTNSKNLVYASIRATLNDLGLDQEHFGTPDWGPFKEMISRGQHVVLKPNFVKGSHPLGRIGVESMITHASVMRPLIDYLLISVDGDLRITICDVPIQSSNWNDIIELTGTNALVEYYRDQGVEIDLLDLRREISLLNDEGIIYKRDIQDRDPRGYAVVNLGKKSALMGIIEHSDRLMVTDYGKGTVPKHHNAEVNEYYIAKTVLGADLFINLPKLKTHRKTGITVAAKNLIGINGDKCWIAHHRTGPVGAGGDEFPQYHWSDLIKVRLFVFLKGHSRLGIECARVFRKFYRNCKGFFQKYFGKIYKSPSRSCHTTDSNRLEYGSFKKLHPNVSLEEYNVLFPSKVRYNEGSWYGNDTLWRTIVDLNYAILYADKSGELQETIQRNYFCLVDGIIAGEREGPLDQMPKPVGMTIGGFHSLTVDFVAASVMGFDYQKIPSIVRMFEHEKVNFAKLSPSEIALIGDKNIENLNLAFEPPINWKVLLSIKDVSRVKQEEVSNLLT
tara:strand:- start:26 stop:1672 length:1647 start_codon:yes stop_codon:yes gene_type:complete